MALNVGDRFNSLKELEVAIKNYEIEFRVSLYKRESRSIASARKKGIKRTLNDDLLFYSMHYACYHGGKNFKSRSKGKRPNQSTFQIDCPYGIWINVSDNGSQLCIQKLVLKHNHVVDKELFNNLPKIRKLNVDEKEDVCRLLSMHGSKWLIKDQVMKETGKKVTLKDLHNLAAKQKGTTDLKSLIAVFQECNG
ncbi:uncharacterized protein LOC136081729 isoform X2 [Hydra vulgaris]|uniref:Uncharacterized protein LOC136081729 isoform X2 n=1 Tax=Hydra vulgaris TaxID=6087 RepID=A0ABM4C284_HYDVU